MIPFQPARIELGQFSPFVNPMEITGSDTPTTPPSNSSSPSSGPKIPVKPILVITGLALSGISAATAYVGISYGMEKGRSDVKRALGWTVGVLRALSGLVRLVGTGAALLMPEPSNLMGRRV